MTKPYEMDYDSHYIRKIKSIPILSSEEESKLAETWRTTLDLKAAEKLVNAHLKLVAKIAVGYRGYGLPLSDLIAEGNIGMLQAMKHFDPEKGFRLSTYAMWWIRASIQNYIMHSWSLVKIGSTKSQKRLFFGLRKTREAIKEVHEQDTLTPELVNLIAIKLKVRPEEVVYMSQRIMKDSSLNTSTSDSDANATEWINWLEDENENQEIQLMQKQEMRKRRELLGKAFECLTVREKTVLYDRRLCEPPKTLEAVAKKNNISRERARQIEHNAILKLQKYIRSSTDLHPGHV